MYLLRFALILIDNLKHDGKNDVSGKYKSLQDNRKKSME